MLILAEECSAHQRQNGSDVFCAVAILHLIGCVFLFALNVHAVNHATALRKHLNGVAARGEQAMPPPHGGQVGVQMIAIPTAVPVVEPLSATMAQPVIDRPASDWLAGWLGDLDMGAGTFVRHAPAFRAHGFDSVPALAALTEADLVAMDVPVGHRRVILAHVRGSGKRQRAAGAAIVPLSRPSATVVPLSRSPRNPPPTVAMQTATNRPAAMQLQQVEGRVVAVDGRPTGVVMLGNT